MDLLQLQTQVPETDSSFRSVVDGSLYCWFCRIPEALQKFMPNNMTEIKFRKKKDAKGRFVSI